MEDLDRTYLEKRANSKQLYDRALGVAPSGINHDGRYQTPFPVYIKRAVGSHKWDVDGNDYVDYVMGHGALLLGHSHPDVVKAVCDQMAIGTHYGACHELEIEWAELIQELIPSADLVRFVSSGTEATMMAMRLCRAFTGKGKVVKFIGHFHGWHDYAMIGVNPPYDRPSTAGIPEATQKTTVVIPANDAAKLEQTLANDNDIACVIIEPSGASWGTIPVFPSFLKELREVTKRHKVLLIFDEVVTGFRYSTGGVQKLYNILPDVTTLAKIVAGGLPGGAVVGRTDIMKYMEYRDPQWNVRSRVAHQGTFNANPLTAAAGVAALKIVKTGEPHGIANGMASLLRKGLNEQLEKHGVEGCVYGDVSCFHVYVGPCAKRGDCDRGLCVNDPEALKGTPPAVRNAIVRAMLTQGAFLFGMGGTVSMAHTQQDIEKSVAAFGRALELCQRELASVSAPLPR